MGGESYELAVRFLMLNALACFLVALVLNAVGTTGFQQFAIAGAVYSAMATAFLLLTIRRD